MNKPLAHSSTFLRSPVNHKTDPELRAWIYQQLAQIEPLVVPHSHIGVKVQREGVDGQALPDGDFMVTLSAQLTGRSEKFHAVATDENVFMAVSAARELLLGLLLEQENDESEIQSA